MLSDEVRQQRLGGLLLRNLPVVDVVEGLQPLDDRLDPRNADDVLLHVDEPVQERHQLIVLLAEATLVKELLDSPRRILE